MIYTPDEYLFSIGIPLPTLDLLGVKLPTQIEIRNWISITSNKSVARFQYSTGIFGEPFVEMNRNSSRVFSLSILQSSPDIIALRALFRAQTFGEIGFPFSILDGGLTSDLTDIKQKSLYPVAFIVDEPQESWSLSGATWVYQLQVTSGGTVYI